MSITKAAETRRAMMHSAVAAMFDDARLSVQSLPVCPDIQQWLLDPASCHRAFSPSEVARIEAAPAYWAFCWPSGQVLASRIMNDPGWVRGRSVLDLGCGGGAVALAAAKAGAAKVLACDIDPVARLAVLENAELNGVATRIEVLPEVNEMFTGVDLVLLADVLYDPSNRRLLDVARRLGQDVWVADARVHDLDVPGFERVSSCRARTVPVLDEGPDFSSVSLYVSRDAS